MTWAEFVVRVQCIQGNPSPPLCLDFISPLKGFVGLSVLPGERVIGALGWWGKVKVSWDGTLDSGKARKTMGEGCNGLAGRVYWAWVCIGPTGFGVGFACTMAEIGCNWARIGPSKSSQSLSIAHKWAVEID
ncbi:hypothetical protein Tco_1091682 [Tanacetum coccineum]|uniref:Uncharacterized protein n=1 Tax=Tanacetum coccineum TaxID=301880 RepID=A0ABQ5I8X6_9ASTR